MGLDILVKQKINCHMVKDKKSALMEIILKVIFKMEWRMVLEFINFIIQKGIKEALLTIK